MQPSFTISSHKQDIFAVALNSDATQAISASKDGILKIHCVADGRQERSIALSNMAISSVLLLPSTVVAGSWDGTM